MKKYILIIFLIASCSAENQLKRAKKLIAKAELQGASWQHDTISVKVPVFIKEISKDTLFISEPGDTVHINKDRLKLIYVRLPGDSVFIDGKCDADTIYKKVPITVTNIIHAPQSNSKWWLMAICLVVGIAFGIYIKGR